MKKLLTILLFLTFFSSVLGQFSLLPYYSLKIYLFDIFAALYVFFCLLYLLNIKKKVFLPAYALYLSYFLFFSLICLIFGIRVLNVNSALVSSMYWIRFLIYALVSVFTYQLVLLDKSFKSRVEDILIFSVLFVAVAGFIQLVVFPSLINLPPELGWDPHINRLTSTFFDPNFAGGYLVLGAIFLYFKAFYEKDAKYKLLNTFFLVIVVLALFLTFSRSSWLMLAVSIFVIGLFKSKKLLIATFVLMFLTYYLVPRVQTRLSGITDPNDSAKLRLVSWKNTYSIAKDNLLLGVGFNTFRYAQERYGYFDFRDLTGGHAGAGSDSSLLLVLATTGVFGFILFCAVFFDVLKVSLKGYFRSRDVSSLVLFTSIISLLIHSQFVNSLFFPQIMLWYFVLIALCYKNS